jgi:hypothetical protein
MKLYEWLLTIINVTLIYAGIALWDKYPGLALAAFTVVAVSFLSYIYFVKTRPMQLLKKLFAETAAANGFKPLPGKSASADLAKIIRQFPGFDDLFFSVEELYTLDDKSGLYFAGRYSLSGYGTNSGYFLLADLEKNSGFPPVNLSRLIDRMDKFDEAGERALAVLPDELVKQLRKFPYDLHCLGRLWLFDFDSRNLKEQNFCKSFNDVLNAFRTI